MPHIKCDRCGKLVEIHSAYMVFCPACRRKMGNSYSEWSKRHPEADFEAYVSEMAVSDTAIRGAREQRRIGRAIVRGLSLIHI